MSVIFFSLQELQAALTVCSGVTGHMSDSVRRVPLPYRDYRNRGRCGWHLTARCDHVSLCAGLARPPWLCTGRHEGQCASPTRQ